MDELATGAYPALIFIAYLLLGLLVGRSNLSAVPVQLGLVGAGTVLAAAAWGSSYLVLDALGADASPLALRLASAAAHDDSTLEVIGNCGTSIAVIGLCLLLTRPGTAAGRAASAVLSPVAAAGATSLSTYSFHIVAIFVLGNAVVWYPESNAVLVWFVVVALVGAWLWRRFLGQGPLERLVRSAVAGVLGSAPAR